ncbi:6-aminohexanoate-dimer hydrolase (Nylon oligomers-degrading enzyme EII) [Leifsonia rubra CMS 76R]|nr:6-aminohexanoate-dimer hydrolase (Nylon oligomers-degrading enzyme EII) [Leifsonia rubra CMS 76R]
MSRATLPSLASALPDLNSRLEESFTDAFVVLHRGEVVHEQYFGEGGVEQRHVLMSVSKSLGALVIGRLVERGLIDPAQVISHYLPELLDGAYGDATVQQTLDMTVAVRYREEYWANDSEVQVQDRVAGWRERLDGDPADTYEFLKTLKPDGEHGQVFRYVSANTDVLAWVVERVTGQSYVDALSTELWSMIAPEQDATITVESGGFAFANGGIACTARDLAKVGGLMLRNGVTAEGRVVPAEWIADTQRGGDRQAAAGSVFQQVHPNGSYRNQWWVTGDERGRYYAAGIHGQFLWIDPSTETVIVKFSSWPESIAEKWTRFHAALFDDIARAV